MLLQRIFAQSGKTLKIVFLSKKLDTLSDKYLYTMNISVNSKLNEFIDFIEQRVKYSYNN